MSEREHCAQEIENYKLGLKSQDNLLSLDELFDETFFLSSAEYMDDLDIMMNVFLKRLDNSLKKKA